MLKQILFIFLFKKLTLKGVHYLTTLATLLICQIGFGQSITEPINSSAIYSKSIELYGDEKFKESLEELEKIDRNDTLYMDALLQKSLVLINLKEYEKAASVCEEGLAHNSDNEHLFYNNLSVALNALKKNEEALKTLDEGLKKYPKYYLLYYNKGVAFRAMDKISEALEMYKKSALLNPYYTNTHINLGLLAAAEGKTSQAVLSYYTFLILEPNTERSLAVLRHINEMVSSKYERTPLNINLSPEGPDDFEELDLIISNYAALSKEFKVPVKTNLAAVKQSYALFTQLEYNKDDKGFWMQTYVPFFKAMIENNKFPGFTYYTLQSSQSEEHKKLVKKNQSAIDDFVEWAPAYLNEIQETRLIDFNGKKQEVQHFYDPKSHTLSSIGHYNPEIKNFIGYLEYYQENGALHSKGSNNKEGKKEGLWNFYTPQGKLLSQSNYLNGEAHGVFKVFFPDGTLQREGSYNHGTQQGVQKEYTKAGGLESEIYFKDGKLDGNYYSFYSVDDKLKHYVAKYTSGEVTDTVYEYYDNGTLAVKKHFTKGQLSGDYITYYRNGKISTTLKYVNGMTEGPFKKYDINGKLAQEGNYKEDKLAGKWLTYENGILQEEDNYNEEGKIEGLVKYYDDEGKLYLESKYSNGLLVDYKYLNQSGEILKQDENGKGNFDYIGYSSNRKKVAEGKLIKDEKNGQWKFYDELGNLSAIENYKEGSLEGKSQNFYKNGTLKYENNFVKDVKEGPYTYFYPNGKIQEEGWYKNGLKEGYWNTYYIDGTLQSRLYYFRDQYNGYQQYYDTSGKLFKENYFSDHLQQKSIFYDTTGKVTQTILIPNGTGEYVTTYNNGKPFFKGKFILGELHGKVIWYDYDGKISSEGTYFNDELHGLWKWYENGKLTTEGNYVYGKKDGKWSTYFANGKIQREEFYINGLLEGEMKYYHENGQIIVKRNYANDEAEGRAYYYDELGELQFVKDYHKGQVMAYSYNDASGKLVTPIDVSGGTYKLVAFYKNGKKSMEYGIVKRAYDGDYFEYSSQGNIIEKSPFKEGNTHGLNQEYYLNGKLKTEKNYYFDQLHGVAKTYYPDGKLEKKENYRLNELHGEAEFYNPQGKLVKKVTYDSGKATNLKTY
ncbi:MAG TPA: hypothetical protein VD908_12895 [Cytophagales bacterium]|nr:hypothetical protein [Cytophagales bacterium]